MVVASWFGSTKSSLVAGVRVDEGWGEAWKGREWKRRKGGRAGVYVQIYVAVN